MADMAFDSDVVASLDVEDARIVISQHSRRAKRLRLRLGHEIHTWHHLIEKWFRKPTGFKRIAARVDKIDQSFSARLAAAVIDS